MRTHTQVAASTLAALLLVGCGGHTPQPTQPPKTVVVQPHKEETVEAPIDRAAANAARLIEESGYAVLKTKRITDYDRIEYIIDVDGISGIELPGKPDGWETVKADVIDLCASAMDSAAAAGDYHVTIYVKDACANNLITVADGSLMYDAYQSKEVYSADNPGTISLAEFGEIRTGMTIQEVFDVVGSPGSVFSDVDLGYGEDYHTITYTWDGEGGILSSANVTFRGGRVISKGQIGLE